MYLMERLVKRREYAQKWQDNIGPKIDKVLEKNKTNAAAYIPALAREKKIEVRNAW